MKLLTITGTKGKTTVSNVLASVLRSTEPKVLHTDTNGVYLNGVQKISKVQSQQIWDIVPTVAPGRFLYLLADPAEQTDTTKTYDDVEGVAVLEAALGSGTLTGLGYFAHDIGIFTNVFEDHLGSRSDLQTRDDIGVSKRFVFARIRHNGYAVFNADDDVVCKNLYRLKDSVTRIPFGIEFSQFDIEQHLQADGQALTVRDGQVTLLHGADTTPLFSVDAVEWTFEAKFLPSVMNLLAVTGALIAFNKGTLDDRHKEALIASRLDPTGGRLTLIKGASNVKILADYAHEKQSLKSVAQLAHQLKASDDNKVIGVLRLAWDRTEDLIKDTAAYIAPEYSQFVIYDKIDGYWRQPAVRSRTGSAFKQEVGKISEIFSEALMSQPSAPRVDRVIREDEALKYAAEQANPGDVVVFIVNDDIHRSLSFVREAFGADDSETITTSEGK